MFNAISAAATAEVAATTGGWTAKLTDPLEWLYPDSRIESVEEFTETDVPANGVAEVNVLVSGVDPEKPVSLSADKERGRWFRMVDVPVEKNTSVEDWCERPNEQPNPYVTRRAPFRVYDALEPIRGPAVPGASTCAFRWRADVNSLRGGSFTAKLTVEQDKVKKEFDFKVNVHSVQLPEPAKGRFKYTNWMQLGGIGPRHGIEQWTDEYYDMLGQYVHLAVRGRQNVAWIPIWTFLSKNDKGGFDLCEERFRRIVGVYNDCGIRYIEGGHLCNCGWGATNVTVGLTGNVISTPEGERDIAILASNIVRLVKKYGLEDRWIQHVADEPTAPAADAFGRACGIVRKHMPGIKLIDAVCTPDIAGALDIWVPNIKVWQPNRAVYDSAMTNCGDEVWCYTCLAPGGKWMNRLMDGELIRPALIPWASSLFGIRGFLHYGFNFLSKGQDPFTQSCWQESPKSNTMPAGDNHIVYPGKDGPWPSVRLESTRQGIEDYELLEEVRRKDPAKADTIIRRIVRSFDDYTPDVRLYRKLRRELLEAAVKSDFPRSRLSTEKHPEPAVVVPNATAVWTADSMRRVTPLTFPKKEERVSDPEIRLSLARNERESAQICITCGAGREWEGVTLKLPELKDVGGRPLAGSLKWERVGYIPRVPGYFPHALGPDPVEKWIPDPLLPPAPMRIRAGSTQSAWLTVYAAPDAVPGVYSGDVKVIGSDGAGAVVRLRADVRRPVLPKTFSTFNSFSVMDGFTRIQYPDRFREMKRASWDIMLDSRLSPDDISRFTTPAIPDLLYARDRGMNLFNLLNIVPEPEDKNTPIVYVSDSKVLFSDWFYPSFRDRAAACIEELKKQGLEKMAYFYGFDEQEKEFYPALDRFWNNLKRDFPGIPLMSTCRAYRDIAANPTHPPPCAESGDWFCPYMPDWNAGLSDKLRAKGKKTWWYTCCGPDEPYANFASIEHPPIEGRLLVGWMTHLYRADGFLFWLVNRWFDPKAKLDESDVYLDWNSSALGGRNGDGVLLYPGREHVLPSIRLANVRDGVEDGELLKMLAGRDAAAADAACRKLVTNLKEFTHDPAALRAARDRILE